MARETVVSNFTLKGREILSSYASYTIEGVMTARVNKGRDSYTIEERNGIAKGTSDGENEAIYIPNPKAIKSIEKNVVPLLPKKVVIKKPSDILKAVEDFDLKLIEKAAQHVPECQRLRRLSPRHKEHDQEPRQDGYQEMQYVGFFERDMPGAACSAGGHDP